MARKTLTDKGVAALNPRTKQYAHPDPMMPGHYIRVSPGGSKQFVVVARGPKRGNQAGKQVWATIGNAAHIKIEDAREKAREIITRIKGGEDRAGPQSFESVANEWFSRYVQGKGLRSAPEIRRYLDKHILPAFGGREFTSIRRGDVAALLDRVEDNAGPVSADKTLAYLSGLFNWYATRNDNYSTPIVKGMRCSTPKERARKRILDDDEIRAVWTAAEANGPFGALVRALLLTGQRLDKVATMRWHDVSLDGVWTIPSEAREKGNAGELQLPGTALEIIQQQPRSGSRVFNSMSASRAKAAFDAKLPLPEWRLHDLRRTARTLMARAGVSDRVAEQVLGHAIQGVEGVYNQHGYRDEKGQALKMLAGLIENILRGDSDKKVRRLRG